MTYQNYLRQLTGLLLVGASTAVSPIQATAASGIPLPLHDVMRIIAPQQPEPPQPGTPAVPVAQSQPPAQTGAAPDIQRRRVKPWVWAAIAAGVGVGVGAGVLAGNSHSSTTAAATPGATINANGNGTAGPPH